MGNCGPDAGLAVNVLTLSQEHISIMQRHVASCIPEEGCGLLAGVENQVQLAIPVTNQDHSTVRYNMEPGELLRAFYDIDARGLEMLASFHSHPNGPDVPSITDIAEFYYPGTVMLIWSRTNQNWIVKGFEILADSFVPIELQINA
ncbi:MAG TPA: M67 family metallopeptidase [Bellilinea sp.]|nr:M67 family metallopeptidase [Bellilinea sp.]